MNIIDRLLWEQELSDYLEHTDEPQPPQPQLARERAWTTMCSSAFQVWTVVILAIGSVGWSVGWYLI